jgi:hypothetical protein
VQIVNDPRFQQRPIATVDLSLDFNVPVFFSQSQ